MPLAEEFFGRERSQAVWQFAGVVEATMRGLNAAEFERVLSRSVHHYTDLGTAEKLIRTRNVWLTDALYCNDRLELRQAFEIIDSVLTGAIAAGMIAPKGRPPISLTPAQLSELQAILNDYKNSFASFVSLVCCFCAGDDSAKPPRQPQDILSQWRGYGSNGKGACVSFSARELAAACTIRGLMFQPVVYDPQEQRYVVESLLNHALSSGLSRQDVVDGLLMAPPLFKHFGFEEEREWRLTFMPQIATSRPPYSFRSRPDVLVPYVDIDTILGKPNGLVLSEVMVGPSNLPDLNESALLRIPHRPKITKSIIPYRA